MDSFKSPISEKNKPDVQQKTAGIVFVRFKYGHILSTLLIINTVFLFHIVLKVTVEGMWKHLMYSTVF